MSERNAKGQFLKGYKGGPGRKPRSTEASVLETMWSGDRPERIVKAVDKMLELANDGDVQAFKSIIAYYAGLPTLKLQLSLYDAALLHQVLSLMQARQIDASAVFQAMISQLSESQPVDVYEGDKDEADSD